MRRWHDAFDLWKNGYGIRDVQRADELEDVIEPPTEAIVNDQVLREGAISSDEMGNGVSNISIACTDPGVSAWASSTCSSKAEMGWGLVKHASQKLCRLCANSSDHRIHPTPSPSERDFIERCARSHSSASQFSIL